MTRRAAANLPTAYFHTVITLLHEFNPLVLANKRRLLGLFFNAPVRTYSILADSVDINWIIQTGGPASALADALVPGGALAEQGQTWHPAKSAYIFPVKALSIVLRAKYRDGCKRLYAEGALRLPPDRPLGESTGVQTFSPTRLPKAVGGLRQNAFGPAEQARSYPGSYTHRVAISNHRLLDFQGDLAHLTFRLREPSRHGASSQPIFSVIRRCVVGKNRVIYPYDGKGALRFSRNSTQPMKI